MKTTIEELKWYVENRELILKALNVSSIYYEDNKLQCSLFNRKWCELYRLQNEIKS